MTGQSDKTRVFIKLLTFFLRVQWCSWVMVMSVWTKTAALFFFKGRSQMFCLFFLFFFFPPHICLSIPPVLESPARLYLYCTVYLLLFCAVPLTSKFPCPFNFLFLPHPGPVMSCFPRTPPTSPEQNMWPVLCFWCWLASQPKCVSAWIWVCSTMVDLHWLLW